MGFVPDLLGIGPSDNSGSAGMGYQASRTDLEHPATVEQATTAYQGATGAIGQQQDFVNALQANNPQTIGNQAMLGNMLAQSAAGGGPNPAQAQYQQNAAQIGAQQAGAIASTKGMSPALQAQLIAQQGGQAKQAAAGQAATLQAQQQISAQNQLGAFTGQQLGQQQQALGSLNAVHQGEQGMLLNSVGGFNTTNANQQANINNANAGIANTVAQGQQATFGGAMQGISGAFGAGGGGKAFGGEISKYADGGMVSGPQSTVGQYLGGQAIKMPADVSMPIPVAQPNPGAASIQKGIGGLGKMGGSPINFGAPEGAMAGGAGDVSEAAPLVMAAAHGGSVGSKLKAGGGVPGKAAVKGDSYKNDTVSAKLSPGEVVIPRSVMESADPAMNAAKFVAAVMAKKRGMK